MNSIVIRGAREHNLKNITVHIPRNKLTVITGVSGSGKSSLAFDTLYAEGQRRYVESLSTYARQFLDQMQKPEMESIEGLSPSIAIEQRTSSPNPRSTVGTSTEIYDFLRVLFASIGQPHCPQCGNRVYRQTIQEMVDTILNFPHNEKIQILSPLSRGENRNYRDLLQRAKREGFVRVRINGRTKDLSARISLPQSRKYKIEVVVDRLRLEPDSRGRVSDSLEVALRMGEGMVILEFLNSKKKDLVFTERNTCPQCDISFPELVPKMFSFNSPHGACLACQGLGYRMHMDPELIIPNPRKSLSQGTITPWQITDIPSLNHNRRMLQALVNQYQFSLTEPFEDLSKKVKEKILYGTKGEMLKVLTWEGGKKKYNLEPFEGVIPFLEKRYHDTKSPYIRGELSRFMNEMGCQVCQGKRLRAESLAVTVAGQSIVEVIHLPVVDCLRFFTTLTLSDKDTLIAEQVLKQIQERLQFLIHVGLGYLTLDRQSSTLSAGEAQRIRLATQIGSRLVGVVYILDEPSIGLHQKDNHKLITALKELRDLGNTVVVVEHDPLTIKAADYILDLGLGAGELGGEVVAQGSLQDLLKTKKSLTAQYLTGKKKIPVPQKRRKVFPAHSLILKGVRANNLKNLTVPIPLGCFVCVTGVSGSGKSTLMGEVLCRSLMRKLYHAPLLC